ncbi:DUF4331 domain-containing protein [Nonomuraea sp. NPDC002799]
MPLTGAQIWALAAAASTAVLAAGVLFGPAMRPGTATSHWDAPATTLDKQIDATDLYAFTSPDRPRSVTVIANYRTFQFPGKPCAFDTNARYEVHIDNTGTGQAALTYRWTFRNKGLPVPPFVRAKPPAGPEPLVEQGFTLTRHQPGRPAQTLVKDGHVAPADPGALVAPGDPSRAVIDLPGGVKVFTGPFFSDDKAVTLLRFGLPFFPVRTGVPAGVNALAIQVPKADLARGGDPARNPVIGVWTTASRRSVSLRGGSGDYKQVSRLGNPGFNEVLIPKSSRDRFNGLRPEDDEGGGLVVPSTLDPDQAKVIAGEAGVKAPAAPRRDLEEIYLTGLTRGGPIKHDLNGHLLNRDASGVVRAEELRLNMSTPVTAEPHQYGYLKGDEQGYPNGRRPIDDVVTVNLRMLLGEPAGPGVPALTDETSPAFLTRQVTGSFPYLALPSNA